MDDASIPPGLQARRPVWNDEVFRARTKELGAKTDRERCAVAGISKASLRRWRLGSVSPSLGRLGQVAGRLGVGINDLIRKAAA
jgi:transcriptional regulator with XRE-family HTH domain